VMCLSLRAVSVNKFEISWGSERLVKGLIVTICDLGGVKFVSEGQVNI
jgi:hypothetical protein